VRVKVASGLYVHQHQTRTLWVKLTRFDSQMQCRRIEVAGRVFAQLVGPIAFSATNGRVDRRGARPLDL